jgi:hypothetical protein
MEEIKRPAVMMFFAANATYATLLVGAMATGEDVRAWMAANVILLGLVLVALEIATVAILWTLYQEPAAKAVANPFPDEAVEFATIRFGEARDAAPIDAVYHEWFSPSLSIDDAEYRKILLRGAHFRVAEGTYTSGATRLLGFYSVWPITRDTFENLISGKLKERDMRAEMVLDPASTDAAVLYLPEICVSPSSSLGGSLLRDAIGYVTKLMEENPAVQSIGAWGYTKIGRSLVKRFCMDRRSRNGWWNTDIYEIKRDDALKLPRPRNDFKPNWRIDF